MEPLRSLGDARLAPGLFDFHGVLFFKPLEKNLKKSLLSMLALAAVAGGAQAQSSVQVMGLMDGFAGSIRMAGDSAATKQVGSGVVVGGRLFDRRTEEVSELDESR